jgi:hypothetical protein
MPGPAATPDDTAETRALMFVAQQYFMHIDGGEFAGMDFNWPSNTANGSA